MPIDNDDRVGAEGTPTPAEGRDDANAQAKPEGLDDANVQAKPEGQAQPSSGRKTVQEQALARRQEKLDAVAEQLERGTLVIRQMTAEERAQYPPRPASGKRPPRR